MVTPISAMKTLIRSSHCVMPAWLSSLSCPGIYMSMIAFPICGIKRYFFFSNVLMIYDLKCCSMVVGKEISPDTFPYIFTQIVIVQNIEAIKDKAHDLTFTFYSISLIYIHRSASNNFYYLSF